MLAFVQTVEIIDNNRIGAEGVYYLTKSKWTSVTFVRLSILSSIKESIEFGNKGCSYLRETDWPQLK